MILTMHVILLTFSFTLHNKTLRLLPCLVNHLLHTTSDHEPWPKQELLMLKYMRIVLIVTSLSQKQGSQYSSPIDFLKINKFG